MSDKSEPKDSSDNNASLFDDITWLVGRWEGEAFGGVFEEVWSPAWAGSMAGFFKLVVDDQVKFYEFYILTIDTTGPVLKLKHFNADLTGWEEKDRMVEFQYKGRTDDELQFDGLVYRRVSNDSLQILLNMKDSDGKVSTQVLNCIRKD